jgi:hypothetical protein
LAFLILALASPGSGQDLADIAPGSRIRVVPLSGPVQVGTLQSVGDDGLSLMVDAGGTETFPASAIQKIQVPDGKNRLKPGLIGGGIGFAAGLIIGGLTSGDCTGDCDDPFGVGSGPVESAGTAAGALIGGVVFGAAGAAIGALGFARDRWRDLEARSRGGN